MSVRSLAALAVERDRAAAGQAARGGAGEAAVAGSRSRRDAAPQTFTDVVISAIPTEPLAAYTALVGIVIGAVGSGAYLPFRWGAYGAFLAIVVAAVWLAYARAVRGALGVAPGDARRKSFPGVEVGSALLAGGAWGLAMPGSPLDAALSGTARTLTTASVLIGTAAVLSLLAAPALKTGTGKKAKAAASGGDSVGSPAPVGGSS
jgi:hypothetical protein